jgi:hypothetical protein
MASKIGFNPQDKFMVSVQDNLVVTTTSGDVWGAEVFTNQLQPLFKFTGAPIGFAPQDRFMVALGNTLVVIADNGSVFGADVGGRNISPVFQFTGAAIGFNPQDRFMVALGNTLVVITDDGSVWGAIADVGGRNISPLFQFTGAGAKTNGLIGFNTQDRFMVAVGNTVVVITDDGSVFGADVDLGTATIQTVNQFTRAITGETNGLIGFNVQDRFMISLGNMLVVIRDDGDVWGANVDLVAHTIQPVFQVNT